MLTRFATGGGMSWLTWSPDGELIAYLEDHSIWVVSANGGQAIRLTERIPRINYLAWSPDGKWIAYYYYPVVGEDTEPIYILNTQTNETRLVTHEAHWIGGLSWSPDSREIVFAAGQPDKPLNASNDIFSIDLDGSNLINLTESPEYEWSPLWFGYRPLSVSPREKRAASWGWLKGLGQ
ncbi:MAG: hypothetical protein O3A46_04430 [Candidatus Poribacteria bacterium]|nr:hypothetical protein [Candidatus Poribacteria bacterium]